jgi:hypothetical protein
MLDWLTTDQRVSYTEASQILDAPETPAPLFAYRALKSVLFGSYDGEESDDNDKENIPLQIRSKNGAASQEIAPQKPKTSTPTRPIPRRMLSPTKSILRTPGIPTPRRQNASVKFKELKQTPTKLGTIAEASVTEGKAVAQQSKQLEIRPVEEETLKDDAKTLAANAQTLDTESQPETYYSVKEIDAYIAATEREMRKLVRYGQRMREYARLSQKESVSLKRELENVKEGNEMLRQRERQSIGQDRAGQQAKNAGLFDLSPSAKPESTAAGHNDPQASSKPTEQARSGEARHQPHQQMDKKQAKSPPETIKSKSEDNAVKAKSDLKATVQPVSTSNPRRDQARVASRVQLPPDKLAAAQARLRLKKEERKKTLGLAEGEKEDHASSVTDWQGL